ncbi:MAG: DUF3137 domain-containing protein [Campylobacter sp.]|nr:DUF3137 domain-containing protein [Campylobacter sp.]
MLKGRLNTRRNRPGRDNIGVALAAVAIAAVIGVTIFKSGIFNGLDPIFSYIFGLAISFIIIVAASVIFYAFKFPRNNAPVNISDALKFNRSQTLNSTPPKSLDELENERIALNETIFKSNLISIPIALAVGLGMGYFNTAYGIYAAFCVYVAIQNALTASKKRDFTLNFKKRVIESIVKGYGLDYYAASGLSLDEFFAVYDCAVDEYSSEDLIYGEIDGVSVKFSDFYAAEKIKTRSGTKTITKFLGVLFVADFNKKLNHITQVCHIGSCYLARYGQKANMDDVKFQEIFNVYTTDQIGARYVLTPTLMQRLTELYSKFDRPVNAVFFGNKIYLAIETGVNNFEPNLKLSLKDDRSLTLYKDEIRSFVGIVKELNLNRRIWAQ